MNKTEVNHFGDKVRNRRIKTGFFAEPSLFMSTGAIAVRDTPLQLLALQQVETKTATSDIHKEIKGCL